MARATQSKAKKAGDKRNGAGAAEEIGPPERDYLSSEEVAAEIASRCDLVKVGCELLRGGAESKGASVKLRMWESVMKWLYGAMPAANDARDNRSEMSAGWDWRLPKAKEEEGVQA
ncbi:MAG TPA: hypothetical protein VFO34_13460 [Candidatus Acidoferrales bacterium]|nr:hypothetical protein [Candidatus Acidoferrales bacterium]